MIVVVRKYDFNVALNWVQKITLQRLKTNQFDRNFMRNIIEKNWTILKILNDDEISFFAKSSTLNFENLTKLRLKSIVINFIVKKQNAKTSTNDDVENFSTKRNFDDDETKYQRWWKLIYWKKKTLVFIVDAITPKKMFFNDWWKKDFLNWKRI